MSTISVPLSLFNDVSGLSRDQVPSVILFSVIISIWETAQHQRKEVLDNAIQSSMSDRRNPYVVAVDVIEFLYKNGPAKAPNVLGQNLPTLRPSTSEHLLRMSVLDPGVSTVNRTPGLKLLGPGPVIGINSPASAIDFMLAPS